MEQTDLSLRNFVTMFVFISATQDICALRLIHQFGEYCLKAITKSQLHSFAIAIQDTVTYLMQRLTELVRTVDLDNDRAASSTSTTFEDEIDPKKMNDLIAWSEQALSKALPRQEGGGALLCDGPYSDSPHSVQVNTCRVGFRRPTWSWTCRITPRRVIAALHSQHTDD